MTALNKKGASRVKKIPSATSYNGNVQFAKNAASQLYDIVVMTMFGKDSFYESTDERLTRLETLVSSVVAEGNLDFIANAIVHARHVMNIRSMPIILTVLFAKALRDQKKQYAQLRAVVRDVIGRADQITDLYAVALGTFGSKKAIPMAIKRGVADAFNKFSEYQFAKYNTSKEVKLRDVLRIVHPTSKNEKQGEIFKKIMEDALSVPYTWETELSTNGQKAASEQKSKTQLWTELVTSGQMGYMALLRNLRNIIEAKVDDNIINIVAERLANPEEVAKSKQLPFRFINALEQIEALGSTKINRAIGRAVDASLGNLPSVGNGVWIILDCSGSMGGGFYNVRSGGATPIKIGAMFASALYKANADANNVRLTLFSDYAKDINLNPDDTVMSNADKIVKSVFGGGTNLQSALDKKSSLGFEPDTVIVLSDMQVNQLSHADASRYFTKETLKIAVNLEGYESTPLAEQLGWYQLSGWSDRIFDFMTNMRNKETVVSTLSVPYKGVEALKAKKNSSETEE